MLKDNVINLVSAKRDQPAYAETALPVLTYDDAMRFHFNGERIDLLHFGPAHTTGDTAVIFRGHKAVHLGDVYNNAGYPFIDADNGGSLNGVIEFCSKVLEQIDATYTVVPGPWARRRRQGARGLRRDADDDSRPHERADRQRRHARASRRGAGRRRTGTTQKGDPANFLNRAYLSLTREPRR